MLEILIETIFKLTLFAIIERKLHLIRIIFLIIQILINIKLLDETIKKINKFSQLIIINDIIKAMINYDELI